MKNNTNWNEIAKVHHEAMVAKGFHEKYSHTDLLLRGIQEVGEAASAWRKNRRADMIGFRAGAKVPNIYEISIKHSIEEELADITLIMLDFAATVGVEISSDNFAYDGTPTVVLMRVSKCICEIDTLINSLSEYKVDNIYDMKQVTRYISSIFSNLEKLAKDLSIDLEEQVRLKMAYNKTREYRHGDKN